MGDVKWLIPKKTGKIRFLLQQEKMRDLLGHFCRQCFAGYCELKPKTNDKSLVLWAFDCSTENRVLKVWR